MQIGTAAWSIAFLSVRPNKQKTSCSGFVEASFSEMAVQLKSGHFKLCEECIMLSYMQGCSYNIGRTAVVIGASVSEPPLSAVNGDFVRPYGCMVLYTANTSNTYFNGMPSPTLAPQCSAFTSLEVTTF